MFCKRKQGARVPGYDIRASDDTTMSEASISCSPAQLRGLFAIILTTCGPSNPKTLWEAYKESMSEDVLREARRANPTIDLTFCAEIFNRALILLQEKCIAMNGKNLSELGLEGPTVSDCQELDGDILQEKNYNIVVPLPATVSEQTPKKTLQVM
jgi:hypothetical protein